MINVHVKCLSNLSTKDVCDSQDSTLYEVPTGTTARELAGKLQLDPETIKLVFINYKENGLDDELHDGDDIAFSPY